MKDAQPKPEQEPEPQAAVWPIGRRRFLTGMAVLGAGTLVPACAQGGAGSAGLAPVTQPPHDGITVPPGEGTLVQPAGPPVAAEPTDDAPQGAPEGTAPADGAALWSDPATWPGGQVPGPGDVAVVGTAVLLDVDAEVAGVLVEPAGVLSWSPDASRVLSSRGNVEVRGRLVIRPASPEVLHTLRFLDVDEAGFVGGGTEVLASDVGLWVVEAGVADLVGAAKRPWSRATGALAAGTAQILVEDATGWRVGDVVVVTPTTPPSPDDGAFHQDVDHCLTYDQTTVAALSGTVLTLAAPLAHDHPMASFADWTGTARSYGAEVLNLSRNVVVEGTPEGKAHVAFLMGSSSQALSHVELRHVGPRQVAPGSTKTTTAVLGRYGLHFHMGGDGTRGSVVDGVVVHDCGGHAFVPHDSHGITLRECVAHDVRDDAFWWDVHQQDSDDYPESHDSLWERCLASKVWTDEDATEGYRMAGFSLAAGDDLSNTCASCVAVGVYGARSTMNTSMVSGFHWPERGGGNWQFRDCLAHNMGGSGIFSWQNSEEVHLLETFTAYYAGKSGIDHGAYSNYWHYRDCALYANRRAGLAIHAVTRRTSSTPPDAPPLTFENIVIDGSGLTRWGVHAEDHRFAASEDGPTVVTRCSVTGCREVSWYESKGENRSNLAVADCALAGPEFFIADEAPAGTVIRVTNLNGASGSFVLRPKSQNGVLVPAWNARRS